MTDHGFIRIGVGSNIDQKTLHEIAHEVSNLPEIVWTHVVKHGTSEDAPSELIIEFDPRPHVPHPHTPRPTPSTYEKLLNKIEGISELIHEPSDVWIIQCTLKGPR